MYQDLFRRSSTEGMAEIWAGKVLNANIRLFDSKSYDEEQESKSKKAYLRLIATHIINTEIVNTEKVPKMEDIIKLFNPEENSLLKTEFEAKKELIETLLKVLPRPFAFFDTDVRAITLKVFVSLASALIPNARELISKESFNNVSNLSMEIKKLYKDDEEFFVFLREYILEGLCDLKSTFLLRYEIIKELVPLIEKTNDKTLNYRILASLIKRLTDGNIDRAFSVKLERDLRSGHFDNKYSFSEQYNDFLRLLFVENTRVLYDGIKELTLSDDIEDSYYLRMFKELHEIQKQGICSGNIDNYYTQLTKPYKELRSYICDKAIDEPDVENKYNELLDRIIKVISVSIPDSDNIQSCLIIDREAERVDSSEITEREQISIGTKYCSDDSIRVAQKIVRDIKSEPLIGFYDYCKGDSHKLFFKFTNSGIDTIPKELSELKKQPETLYNRSLRKICNVYIYIEFRCSSQVNDSSCNICNIVARNILQYRHRLMILFEADFTTDAVSKYAQERVVTSILAHERTSNHSDSNAFDYLLERTKDYVGIEEFDVFPNMLLYVNLMTSRLFQNKLKEFVYQQNETFNVWDKFYYKHEKCDDNNLNRLILEILMDDSDFEDAISMNYAELKPYYDKKIKYLFKNFDIQDKDGNKVPCLSEHLEQFRFLDKSLEEKCDPLISFRYGFSVLMSLCISAVKHTSGENTILLSKDYYNFFKGTNKVAIKIYGENSLIEEEIRYLIIENEVKRIGEASLEQIDDIGEKCKVENEILERKIKHLPESKVKLENLGFSLSAVHYFCKKVLEKSNVVSKKVECKAYYEKKDEENGVVVFKVMLPILKREEDRKVL
jgi:hypothetical protein